MHELEIPDEALLAATLALGDLRTEPPSEWTMGVAIAAAAPVIVATELRRLSLDWDGGWFITRRRLRALADELWTPMS